MSDGVAHGQSLSPHKARQPRRSSPLPQSSRGSEALHPRSKNKTWVSGASRSHTPTTASEGKWDRGGHRGRGRGTHLVNGHASRQAQPVGTTEGGGMEANGLPSSSKWTEVPTTQQNGASKTWEELVKAREEERTRAIREGKMDDPTVAKRLEDAITIVGTCQDMCPEFERYRRERENNLDKWECIIGPDGKPTRKVDHARAVKIYERGQGDKIIPSDLRPAPVLKRTLDYLFHDLLPQGGFADTQAFVRDRSRAVRNDFTIQQDRGPIAIDCHERCARFHILSLHLMSGVSGFDGALETQQLMNSLLSLREFYDDQRGVYQSPNELEMRVYYRLGLIRDVRARSDQAPPHVTADPAFQLINRFRTQVQEASQPIMKYTKLKVSADAMQTFAELVRVLAERRSTVMIYLIACFLENIFGKDTIDDIEMLRGSLTILDIIDGNSDHGLQTETLENVEIQDEEMGDDETTGVEEDELSAFIENDTGNEEDSEATQDVQEPDAPLPSPLKRGATQWLKENFGAAPMPSASSELQSLSTGFLNGSGTLPPSTTSTLGSLGSSSSDPTAGSGFSKLIGSSTILGTTGVATAPTSVFGKLTGSPFGSNGNIFGGPVFGSPSDSTDGVKLPTKSNSAPTLPQSLQPQTSPAPFNLPKGAFTSRSLGDAPPLSSEGEEEKLPPSEKIDTAPPPPFAPRQPIPTSSSFPPTRTPSNLNPIAQTFVPQSSHSSLTFTPPSASPITKANLTPLRTDSLLHSLIDPNRQSFSTPTSTTPSLSFPSPARKPNGSPLTINTSVGGSGQTRKSIAIDSPIGPPPLHRHGPISLPGTPVLMNPPPHVAPSTPMTSFDYSSPVVRTPAQQIPVQTSSYLGLSVGTPEVKSPSRLREVFQPLQPVASGSGVNKVDSPVSAKKPEAELQDEAVNFARKCVAVRQCFTKWKKRRLDMVTWKEACRRSDAYKQKLSQSGPGGLTQSASFKRRRESGDVPKIEPARLRRRLKSRASDPTDPFTDERLVQRLMQNKKENERRWAKGSFVQAIRSHLKSIGEIPQNWTTWLCMNPENDRTAIWLEQKFDVPESGTWESEVVFSIPIPPNPTREGFPGLIVFECTPLEEVADEIERKYRVIDDCARLRDIILSLPDRRHYIPSLLVVTWDSKSGSDFPADISDMIAKQVNLGVIRHSGTFSISSTDLDLNEAFEKSVATLNLDTTGQLVERLNLKDLLERFIPLWREPAFVWLNACESDDEFNWVLFAAVLDSFVKTLNAMLKNAVGAWNSLKSTSSDIPPLPLPSFTENVDQLSIGESISQWLTSPMFDHDYLANNFTSADLSEGFEPRAVFEHLLDLAFLYIQRWTKATIHPRPISKSILSHLLKDFENTLGDAQEELRRVVRALPRPRYKRVLLNGDASEWGSQASRTSSSPSPQTPSNGAKRARMTMSEFSASEEPSQPPSPSPSVAQSAAESTASVVTVSMLRDLARGVLKAYKKASS